MPALLDHNFPAFAPNPVGGPCGFHLPAVTPCPMDWRVPAVVLVVYNG